MPDQRSEPFEGDNSIVMQQDGQREPIVNAPGVVVGVLIVLIAVHGVRQFLDFETDRLVLINLALLPVRFGPLGSDLPGGLGVAISSLATHALLHGDWLHLIINCAWLLAFGSLIARRTGVVRFLLLFIVCAMAGGVFYLAVNGANQAVVIGASGAISGLMGAAFRVIFTAFELGGVVLLQHSPTVVPRKPLLMALTDQRTVVAGGIWIALNLVFGYFGGELLGGDGEIAWEAHLGGFIAGFVLFGLFDRGQGWTRRGLRE